LFKTAKSAAICCDRCHKERKYFADQLKGSALLPFDPITFGEDHGELARKHGGFQGTVGNVAAAIEIIVGELTPKGKHCCFIVSPRIQN
jgi:hypothetical protein